MKLLGTLRKNKPWLDFSSLDLLTRCPRAYYWRVEQELTGINKASLINGQAYHAAKAKLYDAKKDGKTLVEALALALDELVLISQTIVDPAPKHTTAVAVETFTTYANLWFNDGYETVMTEAGFVVPFDQFDFVGKIDRILRSPIGLGIEETKTTSIVGSKWGRRLKPNLQLDGYFAACHVNMEELPVFGTLDVIPIHENVTRREKPFRFMTTRTEAELETWYRDVQEWWDTLVHYRTQQHFPRNTSNCTPIIGFDCDYALLCNMYPNACEQNELEIPDQYVREKWEPFPMEG